MTASIRSKVKCYICFVINDHSNVFAIFDLGELAFYVGNTRFELSFKLFTTFHSKTFP